MEGRIQCRHKIFFLLRKELCPKPLIDQLQRDNDEQLVLERQTARGYQKETEKKKERKDGGEKKKITRQKKKLSGVGWVPRLGLARRGRMCNNYCALGISGNLGASLGLGAADVSTCWLSIHCIVFVVFFSSIVPLWKFLSIQGRWKRCGRVGVVSS